MRKLIFILAAIAMPGQADAKPHTAPAAAATRIIAAHLVDPASLIVRSSRPAVATLADGQRLPVVCGTYSARNHFGGYGDVSQFVYDPTNMSGVLVVSNGDVSFFSTDGTRDILPVDQGGTISDRQAFKAAIPTFAAYMHTCGVSL